MVDISPLLRCGLPVGGKVLAWMRTCRTYDGALSWSRRGNPAGIMSTAGPHQHLEVGPLFMHAKESRLATLFLIEVNTVIRKDIHRQHTLISVAPVLSVTRARVT